MGDAPGRRVVIIQKWVPHYRVPFFVGLRDALAAEDVELVLVHGHAHGAAASYDSADVPGAVIRSTRTFSVAGRALYWQNVLDVTRGAELVIVEHASGVLPNVVLLALQAMGRRRVAFWGHGKNFERAAQGSALESYKARTAAKAYWWFAYTELSVPPILASGFPSSRITVVGNTVDTADLRRELAELTFEERARLRSELGIDPTAKVGLFLGTLYEHKQIPLLLEAGARVHEQEPQFALIVAGDGPERGLVESAAQENPWLHAIGPAIGAAKTKVLAVSDLMLIPGRVGLAVVDAFAAGLPIITRASADHAPEIAYLQHGRNGLVVEEQQASSYAREVVSLLADPPRLKQMTAHAREDGRLHDLQAMVDRFAEGVLGALSSAEPQGRW